jgi:hypothetical protein
VWESLWCALFLQQFWDANRVGVFLHNPNDQPMQPVALWFDYCRVLVWYRWGHRERVQSQCHGYPLMAPPSETLQAATTVIYPALLLSSYSAKNEWDNMPSDGMYLLDLCFTTSYRCSLHTN